MAIRIRHMVAHFSAPFRLEAAAGLYPEGPYAADVHERCQAGRSHYADEYLTTFLHLPTIVAGRWTLQSVPLTAHEIAKAILADDGLI
jgi:hypothetical protein